MAKKDYYLVEKNVDKVYNGTSTNFLDPSTYRNVISKLKGIYYNTYCPYDDCDNVIIYTDELPDIKLLEIVSYDRLIHREILGSLFGLNIDSELFGDIIICNNHYYVLVISSIAGFIINNLNMIGNHCVKLKEVSFSILDGYTKKYDEVELIVSSIRIDNVISSLIGVSRGQIKKKFLDNEIIVNYEVCHKTNYLLKENDVFSIRRYGKYKYIGIVKETKKNNFIINCLKFIDN